MKHKLPLIAALTWGILSLTAYSCTNNTTSSNATISVDVNGDSGCSIVSYLDGAGATTITANGSYQLYTSVTNGSHTVSIYAISINTGHTCTFTINNASHYVAVYNPCTNSGGAFSTSCN